MYQPHDSHTTCLPHAVRKKCYELRPRPAANILNPWIGDLSGEKTKGRRSFFRFFLGLALAKEQNKNSALQSTEKQDINCCYGTRGRRSARFVPRKWRTGHVPLPTMTMDAEEFQFSELVLSWRVTWQALQSVIDPLEACSHRAWGQGSYALASFTRKTCWLNPVAVKRV